MREQATTAASKAETSATRVRELQDHTKRFIPLLLFGLCPITGFIPLAPPISADAYRAACAVPKPARAD